MRSLITHLNTTLTSFGSVFTDLVPTEEEAVKQAITTDSRFNQAWYVCGTNTGAGSHKRELT